MKSKKTRIIFLRRSDLLRKLVGERDLAYAAGFIDGEGCISISRRVRSRKRRFHLSLSVSQTQLRVIKWLKSTFGGSITSTPAYKRPPRVDGTPSRPIWVWSATGNTGAAVLHAVLPYMLVKGKEAEMAIEFQLLQAPYRRMFSRTALDMQERLWGFLIKMHGRAKS